MARIAGINLPSSKRVVVALTYIHGIGKVASQSICKSAGIKDSLRVNDLTEQDVSAIRQYIDGNLMVEGDLRRDRSINIKRLMDRTYKKFGSINVLVNNAARSPAFSSTGPEVLFRLPPISLAMILARVVLPSPGGPKIRV